MAPAAGIPTLHSRAEAWECDFNGHWNTRYYCRNFQMAGEVSAALAGTPCGSRVVVPGRLLRFHSELHSGDPITIRSFNVPDAEGGPLIVHYMFSDGKVVATSADYGVRPNGQLGDLPARQATQALPRGLAGPVAEAWQPDPARDFLYELGPVRREELHDDGNMQFWSAVARMSHASHHHDLGIGFTLELMKTRGIGRMLAEMRYRRLGPCLQGDFLRVASRTTSAKGKAFTTVHSLYTHTGAPVAMFELCTLAVDMNTRRAMNLPDFITIRVT